MKRQLISILLLITMVAPVAGTIAWLQYRKMEIRHEVKERLISGMKRELLVELSFTSEEASEQLDWEHDREFEYKGEMYDVVKTHNEGDKVVYLCWKDSEETDLNEQLTKLTFHDQQEDKQSSDNQERLLSSLKMLFFDRDQLSVPECTFVETQSGVFYTVNYTSLSLAPPSPPPLAA